jgi:hypothetical protein
MGVSKQASQQVIAPVHASGTDGTAACLRISHLTRCCSCKEAMVKHGQASCGALLSMHCCCWLAVWLRLSQPSPPAAAHQALNLCEWLLLPCVKFRLLLAQVGVSSQEADHSLLLAVPVTALTSCCCWVYSFRP